jgi:tubulysin polyketide synthase-like protein
MDATEVLRQLHDLGVSVRADGDNIVVSPASKIPPQVKAAIREHKSAILAQLRPSRDGEHPLLDHLPATREELVLLVEQLADPQAFARWLERLIERGE